MSIVTIGPFGSGADYVCDGIADEVQFNQSMSYLSGLGGGKAVLLDGQYNFSANAPTVTVPHWCELFGEHFPGTYQGNYNASRMVPQVRITNPNVPAFTLLAGATVRQLQAYYPNQVTSGTPNAYQPLFELGTPTPNHVAPVNLEYIHAINPYIMLRAQTVNAGLNINHIRGYPIFKCLEINNCFDFSHFNDIHLNPSLGATADEFPWGLRAWQYANSIMFDLQRIDGMHLTDCLIFAAAAVGARFGNGQQGCSWGHIQGLHVEGPKTPIAVCGITKGTQFNNITAWATTLDASLQPTYTDEDGIVVCDYATENMFNNVQILSGRHGFNISGSGYNVVANGKIQADMSNSANNSCVYSAAPGTRVKSMLLWANAGRGVYFGATDSEIIGNFLHSLGGAYSAVSGNIAIGNHVRYGPLSGTWTVNQGNLP